MSRQFRQLLCQRRVQLFRNTQINIKRTIMKPSSKTPYEIRLDLLQLAQTILENQHSAAAVLTAGKTSPTTEAVIAEAEKLNTFVSKANAVHQ